MRAIHLILSCNHMFVKALGLNLIPARTRARGTERVDRTAAVSYDRYMAFPEIRQHDAIWLAGVYSVTGEMRVKKKHGKYELTVTFMSQRRPSVLDRVAKITGNSVRRHPEAPLNTCVRISGQSVVKLTEACWRWLTVDRQSEYLRKLQLAKDKTAALAEQLAAERAAVIAEQQMTKERRRHRRELLYDNSDPAVQIVYDVFDTNIDEVAVAKESIIRESAAMRAEARLNDPLGNHDKGSKSYIGNKRKKKDT